MRLSKALTLAVPLAALVIAGCGGGGDDSTATTAATTEAAPALSKAELISQGDAICGEVNAAVGSVAAGEGDTSARVSDLYIGMVESIKRLGAPEDTAGYAEFIAAAEELAKVEGEAKLAAEREDSTALAAAPTEAALTQFQAAASEYGFENCGEGPSAPATSGSPAGEVPAEEGGVEVAPEEIEEEAPVEEAAPEEVAPETGGAGGGLEEAAPEGGGGSSGGSSGGVGPG